MESPTKNHAKIIMVEIGLQSYASFSQELPANYNGFVVVLEGDGTVAAAPVENGQVAWLGRENVESQVRLESGAGGLRVILYAGLPLNEPVVARGPFVMNTEAEIFAAYADFQEQRENFGLFS